MAVIVLCLFLPALWVGLQYVIMASYGHTHFFFFIHYIISLFIILTLSLITQNKKSK